MRYTTFGNLRSHGAHRQRVRRPRISGTHALASSEISAYYISWCTLFYDENCVQKGCKYMDLWCLYWEEEKSERLSKGEGGGRSITGNGALARREQRTEMET